MKIPILYNNKTEEIELAGSRITVLDQNEGTDTIPEHEILQDAISKPVNSPGLSAFLKSCQRLLIIVNDGARATPSASVLKHLFHYWNSLSVKFIVATGAHRKPTITELRCIFGELYEEIKQDILIHDAEGSEMIDLGVTDRGTPVAFNPIISQVDGIININSVEPHYFAGFTGGRKSFMPGIAAYKTIENNHALVMQPGSQLLKLKGNPVHEDMIQAVSKIEVPIFSINLVLNSANSITAAFAGNWKDSFYAAVAEAEDLYLQKIPEPVDLAVAVVKSPLDEDLYQAQKGIENCRDILKKDGIMILVATCRGGIGKDNFYRLLTSCDTPEEVLTRISNSYKLGYHKAAKLVGLQSEHQLWMVTEIPEENLTKLSIRKFSSAGEALKEAISQKGENPSILINYDAGVIIPAL
jgi:nickel-dependent lactate racemase